MSIMEKTIYSNGYKYLIEQLKRARKEVEFNQKKVAELLCASQSYVSKVESGQLRIDVIQLKKFAKVYGKNIEFFLK